MFGKLPKFTTVYLALVCLTGCGTTGGKAWTACELDHLPQTGQTALVTVQDIASNPNSTSADLTTAALTLLPGQLDCAAKALLAWLEGLGNQAQSKEQPPVRQALLAAHSDFAHEHAISVLREYLKGNPTSCRPVKVATLEEGAFRPVVLDEEVPEYGR
jgi:hypothetical protein